MWPAENIMQSMWSAVLYRFPTPALTDHHLCKNATIEKGWKIERCGRVAFKKRFHGVAITW